MLTIMYKYITVIRFGTSNPTLATANPFKMWIIVN